MADRVDTRNVPELTETRWGRFGNDRVYVKTLDGVDVGHVDLLNRTVVAKEPTGESALHECLARWLARAERAEQSEAGATSEGERLVMPEISPVELPSASGVAEQETSQAPPQPERVRDLADNVAGAAARARRNEVNSAAPVLNALARVVGVKTEERAWRVGAKGEEKVARELSKLGEGWHVLHAVEVGANGSDIDHVVIGPAGVLTLNTKRHPRGSAWVGERSVMINGQRTDYLRNSRFEAVRASKLLSAACEREVPVLPVIVFVDLDRFTVKQMPTEVHITERRRLRAWLRSLPTVMEAASVDTIYDAARRSTTWREARSAPPSAGEQ